LTRQQRVIRYSAAITVADVPHSTDGQTRASAQPFHTAEQRPVPQSRLRVAAVLDTWIVSGPGRQIAALSRALIPHGVDLRVFMFQRQGREPSPYIGYLLDQGLTPVVLPERGPMDPGSLSQALAAFAPHIVQTHGYRPTAIVAMLKLRRPPWRWIGFFHGETRENAKVRAYNALHRRLLPFADRLVVLSQQHRGLFNNTSSRLRVIHNASIPLPLQGQPVELTGYRQNDLPLIAVLARLSPEKGIDLLLEAAALLRDEGLPIVLLIAGDGPEQKSLQKLVFRLGLEGSVHFLGRVDHVTSLYQQVDLVVLPSRSGAEGLPNVLLEALRADVPVVATAVAAVPEVLADPDAGVLVSPDRADRLAEGIRLALARGMSPAAQLARQAATGKFSIERRAAEHLSLYAELRPDRVATPTGSSRGASAASRHRPLSIEMVLPALPRGGMEVMVASLSRGLMQRGHRVGITCLEFAGDLANALVQEGIAVHVQPCPGSFPNFVADPKLRSHLAYRAPDVVHAHSGVWAKCARAARSAGVPIVVCTAHGFVHDEPWYTDWFRRLALRDIDMVLAVSDQLAEHLVDRVQLVPEKVMTLLNGVDTDQFTPGPRSGGLRERFGLPPSAIVVGCVARLDPIKNHAGLIEAFVLLRARRPDVKLVLIGEGPLEPTLRSMVVRLGLQQHILFAGAVDNMAPVYRDMDVLVLASHAEGTSISLLEALACGTTVVATAVGGTRRLLDEPSCGVLVPPGNTAAIADGIERALSDPLMVANMSKVGRAKVISNFSLSTMVDQYEDLYRRLATATAATG
jgi:glycosyltransferase involved in cell wall biosynthesis